MALPLYALISVIGLIILTPGSVSIRSSHLPSPPSFSASLPVVGIVLGLGTMLGKMMGKSGGRRSDRQGSAPAFGKERVRWAMMFLAFIVGIPRQRHLC